MSINLSDHFTYGKHTGLSDNMKNIEIVRGIIHPISPIIFECGQLSVWT
ncbi:hypothetical protein [Butyrivibrio sp. LC3010]|nr:hypothetical protein [Butyrivibrio sp. LC3010]